MTSFYGSRDVGPALRVGFATRSVASTVASTVAWNDCRISSRRRALWRGSVVHRGSRSLRKWFFGPRAARGQRVCAVCETLWEVVFWRGFSARLAFTQIQLLDRIPPRFSTSLRLSYPQRLERRRRQMRSRIDLSQQQGALDVKKSVFLAPIVASVLSLGLAREAGRRESPSSTCVTSSTTAISSRR